MQGEVEAFFQRYVEVFNRGLKGKASFEEQSALYTKDFIAATPDGVQAGSNGPALKKAMKQAMSRQRKLGAKEMVLEGVNVSAIDEHHCQARVSWRAVYKQKKAEDIEIPFEVVYLMRLNDTGARVFGWIAGDEDALLREYGVIE